MSIGILRDFVNLCQTDQELYSYEAAVVDTALEAVLDISCTGGPVAFAIGDVILHASFHVELQFNVTNWGSQASVKLSSIFIVIVVFWVAGNRISKCPSSFSHQKNRTQCVLPGDKHQDALR